MKTQTPNQVEVEAFGQLQDLGSVQLRTEQTGKLFSIITERLYANPVQAITRELMTNMVDAWMQASDAGLDPEPGYIALPTSMRPAIRFIDNGPGLGLEEIRRYVGHILESSKDTTNDYHGGWGLGMKSPFAYTKQWTIESVQAGLRYRILTFMDASGIPQVQLAGDPTPTDDPSGLVVELPVKAKDFNTFREWARWYACYLPEEAIDAGNLGATRPTYEPDWQGTTQVDDIGPVSWKVRDEDGTLPPGTSSRHDRSQYHYGTRSKQLLRLLLGSIVYWDLPEDLDDHPMLKVPADLSIPIGSLQITPDRDRLVSTPEQIALIKAMLDQIWDQVSSKFLEAVKDKPPFEWICKDAENDGFLRDLRKTLKTPGSNAFQATWNGRTYQAYDLGNRPHYQVRHPQITQALRDLTVANDSNAEEVQKHRGCFVIKRRDYEAPSQVNSNHVDPHSSYHDDSNLTIDPTLTKVYYDDLDIGGIGRFKAYPMTRATYYHRDKKQTILLIQPFAYNNRSYFTDPRTADSIAKVLGIPLDMVAPVSSLAEPSAGPTTTTTAPSPSSTRGPGSAWRANSLIYVLNGDYSTLYGAKWREEDAPLNPPKQMYALVTNAGSIEVPGLPYGKGSRIYDSWDWLRRCSFWDLKEKPTVMMPKNAWADVEHLDSWKRFDEAFLSDFLARVDQFWPELNHNGLYLHSTRTSILPSKFYELDELAKARDLELNKRIQADMKRLAYYTQLSEITRRVGVPTDYGKLHLQPDLDVLQDNSADRDELIKTLEARYPLIRLISEARRCYDAPTEALQSLVQTITRPR